MNAQQGSLKSRRVTQMIRVSRRSALAAMSLGLIAGTLAPAAYAQPEMPMVFPEGSMEQLAPQVPDLEQWGIADPQRALDQLARQLFPQLPSTPAPSPAPMGDRTLNSVPSRTSMAVISAAGRVTTPNASESRSGLSIVKLYLADYALRFGDSSARDRQLSEQMIRYSNDAAASEISRKYPGAITAIAREFNLTSTRQGSTWGTSYTSALDVARYLDTMVKTRPASPVLGWMRTAAPVAADGTQQNWGTAHLPGVTGTKWGWSDYGPRSVASASIATGYVAVAFTNGSPEDQNADVRAAIEYL